MIGSRKDLIKRIEELEQQVAEMQAETAWKPVTTEMIAPLFEPPTAVTINIRENRRGEPSCDEETI
jgi:hypothetical protein